MPVKPTARAVRKTTKINKAAKAVKMQKVGKKTKKAQIGLKSSEERQFFEAAAYRYQHPSLSKAITTLVQRVKKCPIDDESVAIVPDLQFKT